MRNWSSQLLKRALLFPWAARLAAARPVSRLLVACCGVAAVLAGPARAEDPPRRVGSLNYISGEVAYALRGEAGEPAGSDVLSWSQADFNQPVCQDMSLKTGALARARVRIGPDAIQMSGDTWLNVLNLSDQLIEASVRYGRIHLQLSKLDHGETVELEMPRGSLWLLEAGAYDIDVGGGADDQPTRIVVFEGKARFVGGQADLPIAAGEEVQVTGSYPAVVTTERSAAGSTPAAPVAIPAATTAPKAPTTAPAPATAPAATTMAPALAEPNLPQAAVPPAAPEPNGGTQEGGPTPPPSAPATSDSQPAPPPSNPPLASADGRSGSATAPAIPADAGHAPSDDFLLWVEETDSEPQPPPQSTRHVSAETTGYDTLDRYGRWDTLPDSEAVWFPTSVPDDWAPYRFGHWDSIAPWGWTWIDDQPWGFAPFHYGRWINADGHWGWVPGPVAPHPVYAPALVAFIDAPDDPGGGPGNGPGNGPDGGPDVAWFPLGPGDDYAPWYPAGPDYIGGVNIVSRGHFREFGAREHGREAWRAQYFNRRFATMVPRAAFAAARPVDRAMLRVPADRFERAAVMRGAPRVTPAAMRTLAGPVGFHNEARGAAPRAAAAPGGLGREPGNPAAMHEPGQRRGNPGNGSAGNRSPGNIGGRGGPSAAAQAGRAAGHPSQEFGRSETGRSPAQAERGGIRQTGTPQVFSNPAQGYRGAPQQFGRPQVPQSAMQGYRGGAQQFGRPQAFQAPAASYRGGGMIGRSAPQVMARPAAVRSSGGGGGGGRHK